MKILVDEMPARPEYCPFSIPYYRVNTCKLSVSESLKCNNTNDCPYLKVVGEKTNE